MKVTKEQIDQLDAMLESGTLSQDLRGKVVQNLMMACSNGIDMPGVVSLVNMETGKRDYSKATDEQVRWLMDNVDVA